MIGGLLRLMPDEVYEVLGTHGAVLRLRDVGTGVDGRPPRVASNFRQHNVAFFHVLEIDALRFHYRKYIN